MEIELFVELTIPDAVALTTLRCLERMGFSNVKGLKRYEYYKFQADRDISSELSKVDILVNVNKHKCKDVRPAERGHIYILVQNIEKDAGLLKTLHQRLGFTGIKEAQKGTLWGLDIEAADEEKRVIAENIARRLLVNKHYQTCTLF